MYDKNEGVYKKEDDFFEDNEKNYPNKENFENLLLNYDMPILTEDMAEPDISYWCSDDPEASSLLRKCINYMSDKKWNSLKVYLNEIEDSESNYIQIDSNKINKHSFVKNFYLGVAYFKDKQYDIALKNFLEANKLFQYYQLHYNIALCYSKMNKLEEAGIYYEGVISKNPNFFFAYYNLIKICLTKKNLIQAYLIKRDNDKIKLSAQVDINPTSRLSATSLNVLKLFYKLGAECCLLKGDLIECVHTILEALKFNPEDPELWFLYAKVFITKKAFDCAKPLIKRALEIDPNYTEAKDWLNILNNVSG